jgi:hypothetical protein
MTPRTPITGEEVAKHLEQALRQIICVRPLGDVDTCKNPRALIKRMEIIALDALEFANQASVSAATAARQQGEVA